MAETERATEDMSKNWDDKVAESKRDVKVTGHQHCLHSLLLKHNSIHCILLNLTLTVPVVVLQLILSGKKYLA